MSQAPDPRSFYEVALPHQFNQALEAQEALGEAGEPLFSRMRATQASIRVEVGGDDGGTFHLDIAQGRMASVATPGLPPFLTLIQDRAAFDRIVAEAGDSALALLGGLSGLAGEMHLTPMRIQNLAAVDGLIHIEVTGESGFVIQTHLGTGERPAVPDTTITLDEAAYRDLRSGELDPQSAFMNQQILVEGDMQKAMQLAFAAIAPD
jgi:hypothetical protein